MKGPGFPCLVPESEGKFMNRICFLFLLFSFLGKFAWAQSDFSSGRPRLGLGYDSTAWKNPFSLQADPFGRGFLLYQQDSLQLLGFGPGLRQAVGGGGGSGSRISGSIPIRRPENSGSGNSYLWGLTPDSLEWGHNTLLDGNTLLQGSTPSSLETNSLLQPSRGWNH